MLSLTKRIYLGSKIEEQKNHHYLWNIRHVTHRTYEST